MPLTPARPPASLSYIFKGPQQGSAGLHFLRGLSRAPLSQRQRASAGLGRARQGPPQPAPAGLGRATLFKGPQQFTHSLLSAHIHNDL